MLLEFSETGVVLLSQEWGWLDIIRMLVSTFLAAIYLQSGIDKIVDRQGNLDFMGEHFSGTILAGSFHYGLTTITVTELLAGALSATGVVWLLLGWGAVPGMVGALFAGISSCILMAGQRLAKDYVGAAALVPYFLIAIIGLYIYQM
ncbi:MAG: DoxX family protein [Candidatus Poseidoniia archaeon]|nr:DoxX family protein [Candidatus Poseidoniia archaeon]